MTLVWLARVTAVAVTGRMSSKGKNGRLATAAHHDSTSQGCSHDRKRVETEVRREVVCELPNKEEA